MFAISKQGKIKKIAIFIYLTQSDLFLCHEHFNALKNFQRFSSNQIKSSALIKSIQFSNLILNNSNNFILNIFQ